MDMGIVMEGSWTPDAERFRAGPRAPGALLCQRRLGHPTYRPAETFAWIRISNRRLLSRGSIWNIFGKSCMPASKLILAAIVDKSAGYHLYRSSEAG